MGYGDHVPTTTAGKIIAIAVFYIGIASWLPKFTHLIYILIGSSYGRMEFGAYGPEP